MEIRLGSISNSCFVIMPFSPTYTSEYERVIRPAVEEAGLTCVRADEIYSKAHIMSDIWACLRSAKLVIAELTGRNPNVFYELGLAHAIGKPSIIITRNSNDVPFDLQALRYLLYNVEDPYWGDNLKNGLINMIKQVLSEEQFGTVFPDIDLKGEIITLDEPVKDLKVEIIDISGDWKGAMLYEDSVGTYNIEGTLEQENNEISGVMKISYIDKDEETIVEETFKGQIKNRNITLYGTTITFLKQGSAPGYNEDNFTMVLLPNNKVMEGKAESYDESGKVKLEKIE